MADWDIAPGETLLRRDLHARWGGAWYGGIEPAVKADCVFAFTEPKKGAAHGYPFDGWDADGTFHYTGDGQVGDQSPTAGGNKSMLDAKSLGRPIRLFRSEGTSTTYLGEFELADPPFFRADGPDQEGDDRSAIVFRLAPVGEVVKDPGDTADPHLAGPVEVPVEASNIDKYISQHPGGPKEVVRREAQLVERYVSWLAAQGHETARHKVPIPGGNYLWTDVFDKATSELIEAKASAARNYVRTGLGQLLDYSRFVDHDLKGILVPVRPTEDLVELVNAYGCAVIWENGKAFDRQDP